MVNKARMIENIADLVKEKRIDGISDLNDESNREGMRVVVELKREANPRGGAQPIVPLYSIAGHRWRYHAGAGQGRAQG